MEKEKGPQALNVNVVLPANFSLPPPVIAAPPPAPLLKKPTGLIPLTLNEGPRMDVDTFCAVYELPDAVLRYFHKNAITGTHAFSHIMDTDLTGMGFKIGEVIDLKEAVKIWVSSKESFWMCYHLYWPSIDHCFSVVLLLVLCFITIALTACLLRNNLHVQNIPLHHHL